MTAQQMQYHFELKLNQFHSVDKIFTSEDVNTFLNIAQDELIRDLYSKKDGSMNSYFESDEKNRAELGSLIKNVIVNTGSFITSNQSLHENAVFVNLPSDFLYSLQEMSSVVYTDCNNNTASQNAKVMPIRHDEYMMNIDNPFTKPYEKLIWRMDYGATGTKRHELIHAAGHYLNSYTLRYLRKPAAIDINNGIDCELNENLHEEIVDRAIIISLSTIKQLNNENQKQVTK